MQSSLLFLINNEVSDLNKVFIKGQTIAAKVWSSKYYLPALVLIAAIAAFTKTALECMYVYVAICVFMFLLCDDMLSVFAPILFTLQISIEYYRDYSVLTQYMWYAIVPFAAAMLFNIVYYRRPMVRGKFLYPLAAVSAALILGGIGTISSKEYFSATGLYYVLGLGAGQLVLYMLFTSRLENKRDYDRILRVSQVIYAAGLVFAFFIFGFYAENFAKFLEKGGVLFFKPRNYVTSVFLMSIPMVCILAKRSNVYLIGAALMYAAMLLSGSRSGLLFGTVIMLVCAVYLYITNKKSRRLYNWLFGAAIVLGGAAAAVLIPKLYSARFASGGVGDKTRIEFIKRGISNFLEHPLFGIGVGSMKDLSIFKAYVPGSLMFYHNIVIQIISSTGLAGAVAYGWQFILRVKTLLENRKSELLAFGFTYLGILMMSFTNPGIFCPFPEAGLLTLIFALIEKESKTQNITEEEK